jgi:hypothetical protein
MAAVKKRRGPYAAGSVKEVLARKTYFNVRLKEEVVEFLKIGGEYHGVGYQTYLQWLLERALLDEIYYYGWDLDRTIGFDRHLPRKGNQRRDFIHLDRVARKRAKKDEKNGTP